MAELKAGVEAVGLKFRKPKNPGQTRWDSQYDCMVSIRPYKDVITNLAMNNPEWENRGLSASQWKLLEGACETLKHIKDTNKALEGEKEPTMNRVLERLFINHELLDHFISDPKNSREKYGVTFARTLKEQIEKRFPEKGLNCSLRRSANYLDPTFKGLHLMEAKRFEETKDDIVKDWKEIDTDEEHEAEVDEPEVEVAEKPKEPLSPTAKLRERLR